MADDWNPRKLTREQARTEDLLYWSNKTVAERLEASEALTRRLYEVRGINRDDTEADFTPSRVRRSKR